MALTGQGVWGFFWAIRSVVLSFLVFCLLSSCSRARAAVLYVDRDAAGTVHDGSSWATAFTSIQSAINASSAGGEVWVKAGLYTENVSITKTIGLYAGFAGTETQRSQRDVRANETILQRAASPAEGDVVTVSGSGNAGTVLDGFTIRNGSRGVYVHAGAVGAIRHCRLSGFPAQGVYFGIASGSVEHCVVSGNGQGMHVFGGSVSIWNSLFVHNVSEAIILWDAGITVGNNTIVKNGTGIYMEHTGGATMVNNLVALNGTGINGGNVGIQKTSRSNNVYGNGTNFRFMGDPTSTDGNISQDPLLLDAAGDDFHPLPDSPCINAGDSSEIGSGSTDLEGRPRIIGWAPDIGAYEYLPPTDEPPDTLILHPGEGGPLCFATTPLMWIGRDGISLTGDLVYRFRLDGGAWTEYGPETSVAFPNLTNGQHTLEVVTRDPLSQVDPTPAVRAFVADLSPAVVSDVSVEVRGDLSAVVSWATDRPTVGRLEYGTSVGYGQQTPLGTNFLTQHTVTLANLAAGTLYHFRILATDTCPHHIVTPDFTFTTVEAPDLEVSGLTVPQEVYTGAAFPVTWTVLNSGRVPAEGPWKDRVLLLPEDGQGEGHVLATYTRDEALAGGAEYERTEIITIVPGQSIPDGANLLAVETDAEETVTEAIETNNRRAADHTTGLHSVPLPDLVVPDEYIQAPATATVGQVIEVEWAVCNRGTGPTDAFFWFDHVYLTRDGTPDTIVRDYGDIPNAAYLNPDECYLDGLRLSLPNDPGSYILVVEADPYGFVTETDDTNNVGRTLAAIEVQGSTAPVGFLHVESVVPETTMPRPGQSLGVAWTVRNTGDATIQGAWDHGFGLSRTPVWDGSNDGVNTFWLAQHQGKQQGSLAPGQSYTVQDAVTLPQGISGTWFLVVVPDQILRLYEDRDQGAAVIEVGTPTQTDLVVTAVSGPASAFAPDTISVTWTVRNDGSEATPESVPSWSDAIYLSTSETLDMETATKLGEYRHVGALEPGASYTQTPPFTIPICLSGPYHLFVVADSANALFEAGAADDPEANNTGMAQVPVVVTANPPGLQVTGVSVPAGVEAGYPLSVAWMVRNAGPGTAFGTWTDSVYLSTSPTLNTATALLLGSVTQERYLPLGASYSASFTGTLAYGLSGTYYVYVVADSDSTFGACADSAGRTGRSIGPVQVSAYQPPDLQVTSLTAPTMAGAGETVPVSWTVRNSGTVATPESAWTDWIYVNTSNTLAGATPLANIVHTGSLAPGGVYTASASVRLPETLSNPFYLFVCADGTDAVYEAPLEGNNCAGAGVALDGTLPNLQVVAVSAPSTGTAGLPVAVSFTVRNTGEMSTGAASWSDGIYISKDQVLDAGDPQIAWAPRTEPVASGGEYTRTIQANLPRGITGPYTVFVCADYRNALAEAEDADNCRSDGTPMLAGLPLPVDLVVTAIEPPPTATPGEMVTVGWAVTNAHATNQALGTWTDTVYLSVDDAWDLEDAVIGTFEHTGTLDPGQSYTGSLSTEAPGVLPNGYYVLVRTDIRNQAAETDEENNLGVAETPTLVDMPELVLGQAAEDSLTAGRSRYYKVNAPAHEIMKVVLDGSNDADVTEVYVSHDAVPDRSGYQWPDTVALQSDQDVRVTTAEAGWYYVLVYGNTVQKGPAPYTIQATLVPFGIDTVTPDRVGDNGQVTITLTGGGFKPDATVKLTQGTTTLTPFKTTVKDPGTIETCFQMEDALNGSYDVSISTHLSSSVKTDGIRVVPTQEARLQVEIDGNLFPRVGRPLQLDGTLTNLGNIDADYVRITSQVSAPVTLELERPSNSRPISNGDPEIVSALLAPVSTDRSTYGLITLRGLPARAETPFSMRIQGLPSGTFDVAVSTRLSSAQEYIDEARAAAERIRQSILDSNDSLPADLSQAVLDPDLWWDVMSTLFAQLGFDDLSQPIRRRHQSSLRYSPCTECLADKLDAQATAFDDYYWCILGVANPIQYIKCVRTLAKALLRADEAYEECYTDNNCSDPCSEGNQNPNLPDNFGLPQHRLCGDNRRSQDPNDIVGPPGYGAARYVTPSLPFFYTINFENQSAATAAAAEVRVTTKLDPNVDAGSVRLGDVYFNGFTVRVPDDRTFYEERTALPARFGNLLADVRGGVDLNTREITWTLKAIDPETGDTPNSAALGLLPPNDATHRGEGAVAYTARPKDGLATGSTISAQATIVFDVNEPITTNTWVNTLDAGIPQSRVDTLPAQQSRPIFNVSWFGQDDAAGSGVGSYDIYVQEDGGPWTRWLANTPQVSAEFEGDYARTYGFYSVARDRVGNLEEAPATADTVTVVGGRPVPKLQSLTPNWAPSGSPGLTLSLSGQDFTRDSVVLWGDQPLDTFYTSPSELTATVPAARLLRTGEVPVTVYSPPPGGGTSNAVTFTVTFPPTYGDVNGDGTVAMDDAARLLRAAGGLMAETGTSGDIAPSPSNDPRGYGDGRVTVLDALTVLHIIQGRPKGN